MAQPKVDIFVRTSQTITDDVKVNDVVVFYGVRCVEERYFVKSSLLQTTVYRLLLPNDGPVDCRVLPPGHSGYKSVSTIRPSELHPGQVTLAPNGSIGDSSIGDLAILSLA